MNTAPSGTKITDLLLALAALLFLTSASEGPFTPRAGDSVGGAAVAPLPLPLADSLALVDLSRCLSLKGVETKVVRAGRDSLYLTLAGSSRLLRLDGDTLWLLTEGQRGLYFDCVVSEPDTKGSPHPYYRCGTAGGIEFREYGTYLNYDVPVGRFIPTENDTVADAVLRRSIHTGCLNIANGTLPADWLVMVAGADSVATALEGFVPLSDSICKVTVRESIYARGFRYPMLIQERCILYADGLAVDSAACAFVFPPEEIALLDDPENEEIRDRADRGFRAPGPGNPHKVSSVMLTPELTLSANPSVTDGRTTVTVGIGSASQVTLTVSNTSGAVLSAQAIYADGAGIRTVIDLSAYPAGIYIVSASDGRAVRSVKIAKI